jgi:DNA-binding NtrC family response regulator
MNGIELARRLSALYPRMRVLLMSGYPDGAGLDASEAMNRNLLRKPFTPDRLLTTVRQTLDQPQLSS